jgi:ABC-type transport system involved in multi-copper enzyme maturation permease subunit
MFELNPVLVKELRGRMRGPRAFILLTMYLAILGGVALLIYVAVASNSGSSVETGRTIGKALFFTIAIVALIEVCVITPSLTAGSIAGEKERQTYDLLIASQLSPWQIVWGKLGAALAFALLLVLAVVPLMSLAFLFGGISLAQLLIALAGLLVTAIFYACVGLFWSSVMRSTLGANSFALGSIILMLLGIPFLVVIFLTIFGQTARFWANSEPMVYLGLVFVSSHPFIALAMTDGLLSSGEGPFFGSVPLPDNGGDILIISPWLIYVGLALLFSAVLILLSVRSIRPTDVTTARATPRKKAKGEVGE